ncbi:LOW QUALITY PROTEIN: leucine-rich repeat-containing protein 46 [Phaenicophaeus curvirostris]|uniref:LOW QUALITY PROTEIN: leucine-rich repeat-containing protein 46 n=1 Tax=Phaenicophaeus curvirostris TaxID=33595 RepID=UPI0037F0D075
MVPADSGVPQPHTGVPALTPPSPAVMSPPPPPAHRFLPPIAPAPSLLQSTAGPAQRPPRTHQGAQGGDEDLNHPPAMPGQAETLPGGCEQTSPGVTLSDSLPTIRNLGEPPCPERRSIDLPLPSTLRLDRQSICAVGKLQSLPGVHSLYLQQNQIEKIENLACFPNLRFLSLAGNRIRRVENLQPLRHLCVLDLAHNRIETLDPDELPRSLRLLDLRGNNCTQQRGYRELVVGALPQLLQLDGQPIPGSKEEEEEEGGSSSSEDEDDESLTEPSGPFTADKGAQMEAGHDARLGVKQDDPSVPRGDRELVWPCWLSCNSFPLSIPDFFVDLPRELAERSRQRRKEALEEHQSRLEELEELQEHQGLLFSPVPLSSGREGAAAIAAPRPQRSQRWTHANLETRLPLLPGARGQHACLQPQQGPSKSQPRAKALEEEIRARGARNRLLPKIPRSSTAPRGWD